MNPQSPARNHQSHIVIEQSDRTDIQPSFNFIWSCNSKSTVCTCPLLLNNSSLLSTVLNHEGPQKKISMWMWFVFKFSLYFRQKQYDLLILCHLNNVCKMSQIKTSQEHVCLEQYDDWICFCLHCQLLLSNIKMVQGLGLNFLPLSSDHESLCTTMFISRNYAEEGSDMKQAGESKRGRRGDIVVRNEKFEILPSLKDSSSQLTGTKDPHHKLMPNLTSRTA